MSYTSRRVLGGARRAGAVAAIGAGMIAIVPGPTARAGDDLISSLRGERDLAPLPDDGDSAVHFAFLAEFWHTTLDGDFNLQGTGHSIDVGPWSGDEDDYGLGLHARAEADIHRFILFLDSSTAFGHDDRTTFGGSAGEMDLSISWFEFGAGYRLIDAYGAGAESGADLPEFSLDALVGGRVTTIDAEFNPDIGPDIEADHTYIEPYVGLQMYWRPMPNMTIRGAGDVGGFGAGSNFSWQAEATIGYTFRFSRFNLTVHGGYRALGQDFDVKVGEDISGWSGVVHGPIAGVLFEF